MVDSWYLLHKYLRRKCDQGSYYKVEDHSFPSGEEVEKNRSFLSPASQNVKRTKVQIYFMTKPYMEDGIKPIGYNMQYWMCSHFNRLLRTRKVLAE